MSFTFSTEQAAFLSSDHAADVRAEHRRQARKYADSLRIQTALRRQFPDLTADLIAACIEQVRLAERGAGKCGFPEGCLYTADALEMASSAAAAQLHAALLSGRTFIRSGSSPPTPSRSSPHVTPAEPIQDTAHPESPLPGGVILDIAAGIGSDALRLAESAGGLICIESDPVHARFLRHNLDAARRRNALVLRGRAEDWLPAIRMDRIAGVFADPARRDERGRHSAVADMHPPLTLFDRLPADMPVLVKIAPGADPPSGWDVATVAIGRECSEQLLHRNLGLPPVCALHADHGLRWEPSAADADVLPDLPSLRRSGPRCLIEPHAAIIRTGAVAPYFGELGAVMHDAHIAYGWTREQPPDSPWHQAFRILRIEKFNRKDIRRIAAELDFGPSTELKKRGFPDAPEDLRPHLRLRGSRRGVILLTRQGDGHLMVFGERISKRGEKKTPSP